MRFSTSTPFLVAELALFMLGVPLFLWLVLPPYAILPAVWQMALVCFVIARLVDPGRSSGAWNYRAVVWKNLRPMLIRFVVCGLLLLLLTWQFKPQWLFGFVTERPKLWALVMVLYPFLSVIPQEIIFRSYLFARHRRWMGPTAMIIVSGLGFGFAHIVFNNWVAPVLCAVGGILFAHTYHKTRSLALVCLEHALYGDLVFTLGLGRYFYHGAVRMAQ